MLGIRAAQLARMAHVSQPSVTRAEEREAAGHITLENLRKFANAMDCDVVCYLSPRRPLRQILEHRAELVAREELQAVAETVGLEWQVTIPPALAGQMESLKSDLISERPTKLWDPLPHELRP